MRVLPVCLLFLFPVSRGASPRGRSALCPILMGLTVRWVKGSDTEALFLGGLGWSAEGAVRARLLRACAQPLGLGWGYLHDIINYFWNASNGQRQQRRPTRAIAIYVNRREGKCASRTYPFSRFVRTQPPIYVFNWHPLLMVAGVVAETQGEMDLLQPI